MTYAGSRAFMINRVNPAALLPQVWVGFERTGDSSDFGDQLAERTRLAFEQHVVSLRILSRHPPSDLHPLQRSIRLAPSFAAFARRANPPRIV